MRLSRSDGDGCDGTETVKVTLVTTGESEPEDGTFNSLAMSGAMSACSSRNSCCLEIDMPMGNGDDTDYFCEMEYASLDSDLVVGVGFLHTDATLRAATCMADTSFAAVDVNYDTFPGANLEGLVFDDAQGGFLAGYLAGLVAMTTDPPMKVGIVGGPAIPPVARFTTGFSNAVAEACPECEDTILLTCGFGDGGFSSPECGIAKCKELMEMGVGIVFGAGGGTGSAGIQYCAAPMGTNVTFTGSDYFAIKSETTTPYVVGVDQDEYLSTFQSGVQPGASKIITSALKMVDVAVAQAIGNYFSGIATGRNWYMNVANQGMDYAPAHSASSASGGPVTAEMITATDAIKTLMQQGQEITRTSTMGECTEGPGPTCPAAPPTPPLPSPSPPPDMGPMIAAAVGGGVGGLVILCLIGCICYMMCKEKAGKPVFMSTAPPGGGGTEVPKV